MGNCLVTKLKGVVDNDNLPLFNTLSVNVVSEANPTDASQWINFMMDQAQIVPIEVEVIGDGYVIYGGSYASGQNVGKNVVMNYPAPAGYYYLSNGNYKIHIKPKGSIKSLILNEPVFDSLMAQIDRGELDFAPIEYLINRLDAGSLSLVPCSVVQHLRSLKQFHWAARATGDFADLCNGIIESIDVHGCPNVTGNLSAVSGQTQLRYLSIWESGITGSLESVQNLVNLEVLDASQMNLSGNLSLLAKLTNLTALYVFVGTNVSGSIESMVAGFRANGKTSGEIPRIQCYGNHNVTFNGASLPDEYHNQPLSWTPTTITCNGVTINA